MVCTQAHTHIQANIFILLNASEATLSFNESLIQQYFVKLGKILLNFVNYSTVSDSFMGSYYLKKDFCLF